MATIGYVRVSSGDQSVDAQRHSIEQRYKVEEWFSDNGVSGVVRAADRPAFAELLKYARKGDTLIVGAVDRLGRDTLDVLATVESLQAKGVAIISLREGFDLTTPIGKAMLTMLAAVAELERSNLRPGRWPAFNVRKPQGKHSAGRRPSTMPRWPHGARRMQRASLQRPLISQSQRQA